MVQRGKKMAGKGRQEGKKTGRKWKGRKVEYRRKRGKQNSKHLMVDRCNTSHSAQKKHRTGSTWLLSKAGLGYDFVKKGCHELVFVKSNKSL